MSGSLEAAHRKRPRSLRRRSRRLKRRVRRRLKAGLRRFRRVAPRYLPAAAVLCVAVAAYLAWLVVGATQSLRHVDADARAVSVAAAAGDAATVHSSLARLHSDATTGVHRTGGPGWWFLAHLPWAGSDARGVRVLTQVAAQLSSGSIEKLAVRAGDLDAVLPSHGRINLAAVRSLGPVIGPGRTAVSQASARLDEQSSEGMLAPLKRTYSHLQTRVDQLSGLLDAADTAVKVMPQMLGEEGGAKHYILVLQNNAEIRASGGLPGALSEITTDHGRLSITRQTAGADFPQAPAPVLPLSGPEESLYGLQLGEWFLDANFTPDFPRTAELMRARWEQVMGGPVDGVIAVDPVVLSYLLTATGPVTVDGVQLTSANVVDELLHDTYVQRDGAAQDAFFRHVTKAVFDQLVAGVGDPQQVVAALARGAAEHRVLLHDFSPGVQQRIVGTSVSGQLVKDAPQHPQVGVYLNDSTGAKMSYYLRYQTGVSATSCYGGRQSFTGSLKIGSDAPANVATLPVSVTGGGKYGVAPGNQVVTVRIYGPIGGTIRDVMLDGQVAAQQQQFEIDGRPVTKLWAALAPGQASQITWSMVAGAGQTGSTYVATTPSVVPGPSSIEVPSACR